MAILNCSSAAGTANAIFCPLAVQWSPCLQHLPEELVWLHCLPVFGNRWWASMNKPRCMVFLAFVTFFSVNCWVQAHQGDPAFPQPVPITLWMDWTLWGS
jgi:hypothetical protein